MQTVLITGSSSGYGLETARYFLARGWNVVATMRNPERQVLPPAENLKTLQLDVTIPESIAAAVEAAGPIDVLVNNAGIGGVGAFEATPFAHIRKLFDTNTFGVMAVTQAVIPQMRRRRSGVIVNVTSSVTLGSFPLAAAYTASKQAVDGFTRSLAHELGYFGVRVCLVQPGYGPTTRFAHNSDIDPENLIPEEYQGFAAPVFRGFARPKMSTREIDVAEAVWTAVSDDSPSLDYPAGEDALALATARGRAQGD